jgi:site-specific DNA recombinase
VKCLLCARLRLEEWVVNRRGGRVSRNGLSVLLNNPFYIGLIRIHRTQETFPGNHPPLIPKSIFDRVQGILSGKTNARVQRHDFLFRRLLRCKLCGSTLVGEHQKGHCYYRCHTRGCPTRCIREELVDFRIQEQLSDLCFSDEEKSCFAARIAKLKVDWGNRQEDERKAINLRLGQVQDRLNRLTDAFLDGAIDRELFEQRKAGLLMEKKAFEENLGALADQNQSLPDRLAEFLELAGSAWLSYRMGISEEKRDLLKITTSNRLVDGKNLELTMSFPFSEVAKLTRPVT